MAKATAPALDFQIEDFTPEPKANPYAEHVAALIAAGEGKALSVTFENGSKRDGSSAGGTKGRNLFQSAANDAGYTARVRSTVDNGDGTTTIKFTLTAKHNRGPRKPKPEGSESYTDTDSVEAVAATE